MIETNLISEDEWRMARSDQPSKWANSHYFSRFNQAVEKHVNDFSGRLEYYKFNKSKENIAPPGVLEYTENSPIINLFKVSPYGYYLNNYKENDIWRQWDIDSSIVDHYQNMQTNKYEQGNEHYNGGGYILFPLQSNRTYANHSFNLKKLMQCMLWANANKRTILFKLHPHTDPNGHLIRYWGDLEKLGVTSKYTQLIGAEYNIDSLITNADAVWSFSSGAILQSVLKGKPTVSFWPYHDWLPVAPYCNTPEDAAKVTLLYGGTRDRFLSWYYQSLTIDVNADDFEQRLVHRFEICLGKNETSLHKIFGPLGAYRS